MRANSTLETLASEISDELKKAMHCAVYEPQLTRAWPHDGRRRELQITSFAKRHGWRLGHYKDGFCAIFVKKPRSQDG